MMNVNGIQNRSVYKSPEEIGGVQEKEPVKNVDADDIDEKGRGKFACDEYVPEDKAANQPAGVYKIEHDEEGNPKVRFDGPSEKPEDAEPEGSGDKSKAESCTVNTDKVDREIEKLKQEKEQCEQRLRNEEDPKKASDLERKLAKIENELRQKDNDTYRRQHASVS